MAEKTTRLMITVPVDMAQRAEALKREIFYDKPYAEMYRQFIRLGIEKIQESTDEKRRSGGKET